MKETLEQIHKTLGAVCGEVCMALTLGRIPGGRSSIRRWKRLTAAALDMLENLLPEEK